RNIVRSYDPSHPIFNVIALSLSCHSGSGCVRPYASSAEWARLPPCCDVKFFGLCFLAVFYKAT
ncbi:hypothetical protein, partial [Shigella sonnei]|uniref:hypothetical protein n=1 Tax=Shigella sonnei TaxID=624 RepID=UPI0024BCAFC2